MHRVVHASIYVTFGCDVTPGKEQVGRKTGSMVMVSSDVSSSDVVVDDGSLSSVQGVRTLFSFLGKSLNDVRCREGQLGQKNMQ